MLAHSLLHARPYRIIGILLPIALAVSCAGDPAKEKQAFFDSAERYFASEKYREAIVEYRNALEIDPRFGQARIKLAQSYARLGDARNALGQFVRAADLMPADTDLQLTAGRYLLAAGRPEDARGRADAVLARDPRNAAAHVLRGSALAGLNSLDTAVEEIEQAIQLDPAQANAYAGLGVIQLARGRTEEAERALRMAIQVAPKWAPGYLGLANYYWAVSRISDAEAALRDALAAEPANPLANRAMASFCIATGRPALAEEYLKRVAVASNPNSILVLADYYVAMGRPRDAITQLEPLKSDSRVSGRVQERLIRAYAAAGDRPRAYALVEDLLKRNPRDARAQLAKGQLLAQDGKRDEAFPLVRAAAEEDSTSVAARFLLGRLYAARGDVSAAEASFTEVLKLNPRAGAAQVELSNLYLASSRLDASLSSAREAMSSDPGNPQARVALVRALIGKQDLAAADREVRSLLVDHPQLAIAHVQAGALAAARGDMLEARAALDRAVALDSDCTEALAGLVLLDLRAGKPADARARVEARIAAGSPSPSLLLVAARVYAATNDASAAEAALRKAIASDPGLLPAYSMLGQLYVSQRRLADARREFEALARNQVRPVAALTMIGIIHQIEGNVGGAREQFEKALALDPQAAVAANNLAWLYAENGENLDVALQLARTAVAGLPDQPEVSDTLGWILCKKELPALAIPVLKRVAEREPANPVYQYHLGTAYLRAGDEVHARQALTRALASGSQFQGAADAVRALNQLTIPSVH